jgi:hypothetical protein
MSQRLTGNAWNGANRNARAGEPTRPSVAVSYGRPGIRVNVASRVTVQRREIDPQPAQIENGVDPAQQMISWNALLEIKLVEQSILSTNRRPIIPISRPDDLGTRNHATTILSTQFFNSPSQEQTWQHPLGSCQTKLDLIETRVRGVPLTPSLRRERTNSRPAWPTPPVRAAASAKSSSNEFPLTDEWMKESQPSSTTFHTENPTIVHDFEVFSAHNVNVTMELVSHTLVASCGRVLTGYAPFATHGGT